MNLDLDQIARWVKRDLRDSGSAADRDTAARLSASAGVMIALVKKATYRKADGWKHWLPEFVGITPEEGQELISSANSWRNIHRWDGGSFALELREMAISGRKPGPSESPEFQEAMQAALTQLRNDLEDHYDQ